MCFKIPVAFQTSSSFLCVFFVVEEIMVENLLLEKSRINISDLWSIFHIHRIGQFRNTKNMLDISSDAVIHREEGKEKRKEEQNRDKKV